MRPGTDNDVIPAFGRGGLTRRQVLSSGIGGLAGLAVLGVPGTAWASTEPTSRVDAGRLIESLNGTWDFLPSAGAPSYPPPSTGWASIPVPAEWNMTAGNFATAWGAYDIFETPAAWDSVDTAWYRRTVTVPAERKGDRIVLRFEAVNFESTVLWNGVQVAHNQNGLLPFEVDVTDQVAFGTTNTIHVLVRSPNSAARQSDGFHFPCGSWWGQLCAGIWQDVWLLARPAVSVDQTAVTTSVRNHTLAATTTIRNDGGVAATVWVAHEVRDGSKHVLGAASKVTVPAGGTSVVEVSLPWAGPHLWSPEDPHLYDLVVEVHQTPIGPAADSTTTRFGFREVWVDGDTIQLNGAPVLLRGDAWHYMGSVQNSRAYATLWMTMAKAAGVNYMRLHAMPYPPVYYDVADELGMLIVGESGIYGSSGNYALGAADFWDNCSTHLTGRIVRDRNHPSIIAWSLENEVLAASGQSWASKLVALKPIALAADATRPVYFEGDGDPQSQGDIQSTHYPIEMTSHNTAIPESGYALAPGGPQAGEWNRQKPFLISEFSAMYYANPVDVSAIGGPDVYASLDGLWTAHAMAVRAQIEGFRYAGVTGISPWNTVWYGMRPLPFHDASVASTNPPGSGPQLRRVGRYATTLNPGFENDLPPWEANPIHDAVTRVFHPIAALAKDYRTHYWSGGALAKTLAVYNSTTADETITVSWSLQAKHGRVVTGRQQVTLAASTQADVTASVALPAVGEITEATWKVTATTGGRTRFTDTLTVTIHPAVTGTAATSLSAAVLEAPGSTATSDALSRLGVATRVITDLTTMPTAGEILVLGEGSNFAATGDDATRVGDFVKNGGTALILAQQSLPQVLPWPMFAASSAQTITHVCAPHHPVLAGIGKDDLRWWQTPNEQVVQTVVIKPRFGSLISLADSGVGLSASALAEAAYGTGTFLLCQYPLIAAAAAEPVAAMLLHNIVGYLSSRKPSPAKKIGVLASSTMSAVAATLQAASIAPTALTSVDANALAGVQVLVVDASPGNESALASLAAASSSVNSWVDAGGTLWINGAQPSTLPQLASVLPAGLSLTAVDAGHQFGGVVTGRSPLTDGINNADVNWTAGGPAVAAYTVNGSGGTSLIETIATNWAAFAHGAEQNKYAVAAQSEEGFTPGTALWQASAGKGAVLVDQLGWPTSASLPAQVGLAASLAAALGVDFVAGSGSGLLSTTGWHGFTNPAVENPANAFDRNPSTRWSSDAVQVPGMYYGLDLGATHTITKVIWDTSESPGDYPRGLDLQISADGQTWTSVLTVPDTSGIVAAGVMTLTLKSVTTRYLRFVDTGSAPGNYLSLHELYVYASD